MDDDQHAEIIKRLDALASTVDEVKVTGLETKVLAEKTNGRVTQLEGWRVQHNEEHKALTSIVEMAVAIAQIRKFVLYVLPFLSFAGAAAGAVVAWQTVL